MCYSVLWDCEEDAHIKVSKSDARTSQMLPKWACTCARIENVALKKDRKWSCCIIRGSLCCQAVLQLCVRHIKIDRTIVRYLWVWSSLLLPAQPSSRVVKELCHCHTHQTVSLLEENHKTLQALPCTLLCRQWQRLDHLAASICTHRLSSNPGMGKLQL